MLISHNVFLTYNIRTSVVWLPIPSVLRTCFSQEQSLCQGLAGMTDGIKRQTYSIFCLQLETFLKHLYSAIGRKDIAFEPWHIPDSITHTICSQGTHHAKLLQGGLVLPFLGELLLLWTLTLYKLLPPLGGTLDVSVQVAEIFHRREGLYIWGIEEIIHASFFPSFFPSTFSILSFLCFILHSIKGLMGARDPCPSVARAMMYTTGRLRGYN